MEETLHQLHHHQHILVYQEKILIKEAMVVLVEVEQE
jgi:hypothetical protein